MHVLQPDDLQLISSIKLPLLNIIVAVYKDNEELATILNKTTGINGYIGKYWTGFFPILIIQTCSDQDDEGQTLHETNVKLIKTQFSFCHRLVLESMGDDEFLMESIVRYHLHVTHTVKKNLDYNPALAGLQQSLRIELDFYPADSHPDRAGK